MKRLSLLAASALLIAAPSRGHNPPCLSAPVFTWTKLSTVKTPPGRADAMLAYDSSRDRVVLFGGAAASGAVFADTWEFNGTIWEEQKPSLSPSKRWGGAMAYDPVRKRVVLFGGRNLAGELADTWEWDGSSWAPAMAQPASSPGVREYTHLFYDMNLGKLVLFGGSGQVGILNDMWTWNGESWTVLVPKSVPPPRYYPFLTYDSNRRRAVMFGGLLGVCPNVARETWEWDGATWTQVHTIIRPSRRHSGAMSLAGVGSILFGGYDPCANARLQDTWHFDGKRWLLLAPGQSPAPRHAHVMAFDAKRSRVLLFGGSVGSNLFSNELWSFALPAQTWTETGDAGDLPGTAQVVAGSGPLTQIDGTIDDPTNVFQGPGNDRDMYLIQIDDPAAFEATTIDPLLNTQLFLFDLDGVGVSHNDNEPTGFGLNAQLTGQFVPGPGLYYIAVSRFDRDPTSGPDEIWTDLPLNTERAPDGPGAAAVIDGWNGGEVSFSTSSYSIVLTGTVYPGTASQASFNTFGTGCPGSVGIPTLDAAPGYLPWIGETFEIQFSGMPPNLVNAPFGILGLSKTQWGEFSLPLDVSRFGFLGCTLYASLDFSVPLVNMGGTATWEIEIPSNPYLLGLPFYVQGVVLDFGVNPGHAIVTNAGEGVLGAR